MAKQNTAETYTPISQASQWQGDCDWVNADNPRAEWRMDRLPRPERYTVEVSQSASEVGVTYQAPIDDKGLAPILLSPGFTAGETSFTTLHRALGLLGYPSFSLSHHRKHDSRVKIQTTHAMNDIAVMEDAYRRYGYGEFYVLGWSMGAGDVVHIPEHANNNEHDKIKGVVLFNGMGQIEGDTFVSVSARMARALARDAQLTSHLPLKHRLMVARSAMDSLKRAATNVHQTAIEAAYAASFDIREIIGRLLIDGLPVYQINSEHDTVFLPANQFDSTAELPMTHRCVVMGEYATHISGLFVPKATAEAVDRCLHCDTGTVQLGRSAVSQS